MKNLIEEQANNLYNLALDSYKGLSGYSWIIQDKDNIIDSFKKDLSLSPLEKGIEYNLCSHSEPTASGLYKVVFKFVRRGV
jgi:hypothetical protein